PAAAHVLARGRSRTQASTALAWFKPSAARLRTVSQSTTKQATPQTLYARMAQARAASVRSSRRSRSAMAAVPAHIRRANPRTPRRESRFRRDRRPVLRRDLTDGVPDRLIGPRTDH